MTRGSLSADLSLDEDALAAFSRLVGEIYEASLAPEQWPAVLGQCASWMDAPYATLFTPALNFAQGGFMYSHGLDADALLLWTTRFHQLDLWAQRAYARGIVNTGDIVRDQDLVSEEEFLTSQMYREFFAPRNIGRVASGIVFGLDRPEHPAVACSFNRAFEHRFQGNDLFHLRLLLPHLSRALGLMFRLREADFKLASSLTALERLPQAVILFDIHGQVSLANAAARDILVLNDGLSLGAIAGRADVLRAGSRPEQALLDNAIRRAIDCELLDAPHFATALAITRPSGGASYVLHFSSLPAGNEFGPLAQRGGAIAFLDQGTDLSRPSQAHARTFQIRYGLTEAEMRVTAVVAQGQSVEEVGVALGLSANTIKTHLKNIYQKTGASSRAVLVRLWLASST